MKAVVYKKYGSPDNLSLQEVEIPSPKRNEVLVKVHAVSLNSSDREFLNGTPVYIRMWGLLKPKYQILGSDIAGTVEAVGADVTRFKPGDEVLGDIMYSWGGLAEYVCAGEHLLTTKPASITFEQAAAIPQAGVVALQGLGNGKGKINPGQKVLINGAGGGAGSFAVQLAKYYGVEVTGVDSAEKLKMVQSIGADHVIDYTGEDFTRNGKHYDLILDMVAGHSIFDYKRALSPEGNYIMVGGSMGHLFQVLILGSMISVMGKKKMSILTHKQTSDDLDRLIELMDKGVVQPVIDKTYSLTATVEAFQYLQEGHNKGKVLITI